jgi:type I restriction enzyme, R subunit
VRFTLDDTNELVPWTDTVNERFTGWVQLQHQGGRIFDTTQMQWLELMRDQIAGSLAIDKDALMEPPFSQHGGLGRAAKLFGADLDGILAELNEALVA